MAFTLTRPFKRSFLLLAESFKGGRKVLSAYFGLSQSSVDKMMEEPRSDENPDGSGQRNYLDESYLSVCALHEMGRVEEIHAQGRWLAHIHGGFFTPHFEPSNLADNDFCRILNGILSTMNLTIDELRRGYFEDGEAGSFTRMERAEIYRKLDGLMSQALIARKFVHAHKAEEGRAS